MSRRLTLPELESMRRSLGMADQLPVDQVRYLIAEAERLLRERASIDATIARLGPPWRDVRTVLNELAAIVTP